MAAVAIVLAVVLSGGGGEFTARPPTPPSRVSSPPPSPTQAKAPKKQHKVRPAHVRFRVAKLSAVAGRRHAKPPAVREGAHRAARHVAHLLGRLYTLAYTRAAGHERAPKWLLGFFAGRAQAKARHHLAAITIGGAGPGLRVLRPKRATLSVRVLLDRHNRPFTAVAAANFKARGRTRHGGALVVHSWARYFLEPKKKGWAISAFDARRQVRRVKM